MLDIQLIKQSPDEIDQRFSERGFAPQSERLIGLDERRREAVRQAQEIQTERNEKSKKIGHAKAQGDEATAKTLMQEVTALKQALAQAEEAQRQADVALKQALAELPNLALADVPVGEDETANLEIRKWGEVTPSETATPHFEIGEMMGQMDFELAASISGARFVILRRDLARLERALGNFMIDLHSTEFGYEEVSAPVLVRDEVLFGTGQLPKFADDSFRTENGYWLAPTAEAMLTNLVREAIHDVETFPLRFTAWTQCFRSEAGAAGRDTRGMIRQHQFGKVELVSIVEAEDGLDELERMTACAEEVLKRLQLPYRVMLLSTGDMGFAACKTYDLEVWMPGQQSYREISSCSYCGDFQARRMNARWRAVGDKQTHFVHTLNGSALAIGRTLAALLENYYQGNGVVAIPDMLQNYMGGQTELQVQDG